MARSESPGLVERGTVQGGGTWPRSRPAEWLGRAGCVRYHTQEVIGLRKASHREGGAKQGGTAVFSALERILKGVFYSLFPYF